MTDFLSIHSKKIEIQWHNKEIKNRPCLIFLHEGLGCTAMWKEFPGLVSQKTNCPALVFSRLGYGKSDASTLPWKLNFMHKEALKLLPEIIKAAKIKNYILIGHSDGGSIGIIFSGSPHATGLKGLITLAAHVFCEQISVDSIFQAKINYENGNLKQGLEKYHEKNTENAFRGWNDAWLNPKFMHWNIEKYLKHIQVPMLSLQGKDDQYGTPKQLESIKTKVANIGTLLLDNCKHAPHSEQTKIALDLIARFISKVGKH
ncbi:MAG: alpha/beta hydrolase [Desulfobacula sp.]|nr:alpha/beta hydrolase [Desulfobacula sp.]